MSKFAAPAYNYAEVETGLARALDVGLVHQRGALRGRLKHFQRLGLVDIQVGKSRRVEYTREQASQWLVALILAETGLDPTLIVPLIKKGWKDIAQEVERAANYEAQSGNPWYLLVRPQVLTAPWKGRAPIWLQLLQLKQPGPFVPGLPWRFEQPAMLELVATTQDHWFCAYNLTRAMTRLENSLPPR